MESFQSSVSSASEASGGMTPEPLYKAHALEEGDSGIGKGSLCSDESTSLVSDGTNSLEKNEKPPRFGYSKGAGFARRIASAGTYSCTYFAGKSKKQDREQLTPSTKEPWTDLRTVGSTSEQGSVYHTLEPEIFEEDNSCTSDDVSCDSTSVGATSEKPKAYAYAKVKLDQNTGMLFGSDPRYGVFPVQSWDRPGSTEYGSLASSTMTLHSNNGYDRLDRNCRKHQQGESAKSKLCRHRDFEQQLVKLKPPPPPVSPKPPIKPPSIVPQLQFHPARVAPPPPIARHSLGVQSVQSDSGSSGISSCQNDLSMRQSIGNESINSDTTLTPPLSPNHQLLNVNHEFKRFLGSSLGDISVRSEGGQLYSNTKPSYTRVGGSWNDISTTKTDIPRPKLQKSHAINTEEPSYSIICKERSSITRETVSEISNRLNGLMAPAIFVQNSNESVNSIEPPYTTVMRVSSASDVSSISDGKLTPPPQRMKADYMYNPYESGSMSDISLASDDRYVNSSARNTGDFSDIDLSTPRNTKDFSDIELVNLSSESLKMDTRYSIASSSYTYT